MSEKKTHAGGCHCGKVRYEVTTDLGTVISCNCSMCSKRGTLLSFVPSDQFTLKSGAGELNEYLFNKHVIRHKFCKTCGILSFAEGKRPDGKEMVAINVRCLDDVDPKSLKITEFDGKSL